MNTSFSCKMLTCCLDIVFLLHVRDQNDLTYTELDLCPYALILIPFVTSVLSDPHNKIMVTIIEKIR